MNGLTTKLTSNVGQIWKELDAAEKKARGKAAAVAVAKLRKAPPKGPGRRNRPGGNLRRSLKVKNWRRSAGVGFTRPLGAHAWLVENPHDIVRNGVKVGRTKGNPFFRTTWDAMVPELQKLVLNEFGSLA